MKRGKKSQVSIFIIIGILIIVSIALFLTLRKSPNTFESPELVSPLVDSCIKTSAEESLDQIGRSGGYYLPPKVSTSRNLPYYFYKGQDYSISKEQLEIELSRLMDNNIFFCTKNFIDFPDYEVKQGEIKTTAEIEDKKISFNVNYPLSISKGEKIYVYDNFFYEKDSNLGLIYKSIKELLIEQNKQKDSLCISCLGEITERNDLYAELFDSGEDLIIKIIDKNIQVKEEDYAFYFAIKYA